MLGAVWGLRMRRRESWCGCGQMLAELPAGGGWAHLSLPLPISLSVAEAGDRWSPEVPAPLAKSVLPALRGNTGTGPGTRPGSTAYRAGSPHACFYNLSAAPTWTRVATAGWSAPPSRPDTPSQGRTDSFESFRPCQLTFQRDWEREGPDADVFYMMMRSRVVPKELSGSCDACLRMLVSKREDGACMVEVRGVREKVHLSLAFRHLLPVMCDESRAH